MKSMEVNSMNNNDVYESIMTGLNEALADAQSDKPILERQSVKAEIEKPTKPYVSSLKITDESRKFAERREKRARELGIAIYTMGDDPDKNEELQKLEDYIMENFIDLDLDVPDDLKEKYLFMKNNEQ